LSIASINHCCEISVIRESVACHILQKSRIVDRLLSLHNMLKLSYDISAKNTLIQIRFLVLKPGYLYVSNGISDDFVITNLYPESCVWFYSAVNYVT